MMEAFKKKGFTQEYIEETTNYIQGLMSRPFEEVDALARTSWKHCKYVMDFFSFPKTELHKAFDEKFNLPIRKQKEKKLEWKIMWEMKENKQKFIKEHLIDSYQYNDVKYQIVDRYVLASWDEWEEIIQISIPYFSPQAQRDKFWYWILVSRTQTPEFFDRLVRDMRVYNGNADLTSNKK